MSKSDELLQTNANKFDEAAQLWEKMSLPNFSVEGYLDGKQATWNVPEVLRVAAKRLREIEKEPQPEPVK